MIHINANTYLPNNCFSKPRTYFSKREKECIQFLLMGMTAKEIAKKLQLSHRTVESYLENIKYKTECPSKSQLISKILTDYAEVYIHF